MKWVVQTLEMAFHSFDEYGDIIMIVLPRFVAIEGEFVYEITHLCAEGGAGCEARLAHVGIDGLVSK